MNVHPSESSGPGGFTLIELLVVITILVVLLALLAPAMDRAIEMANRAVCASNLHNIHANLYLYATEDKSKALPPVRNSTRPGFAEVLNAFDYAEVEAGKPLYQARLAAEMTRVVDDRNGSSRDAHPFLSMWNCPSRTFTAHWEDNTDPNYREVAGAANAFYDWQGLIGYMYMGSQREWRTMGGVYQARSPKNIRMARGNWVLAADFVKYNGSTWVRPETETPARYGDTPPHTMATNDWRPQVSNHALMDGAIVQYGYEDLIYFHTWSGDNNVPNARMCFWYQGDKGDFMPQQQHRATSYR
jgi:prepilin-type N-terminal cleavage/methylation domain-containing protein